MENKINYAPYIRTSATVSKMMLELLICAGVLLIPALFVYGFRVLTFVFMSAAGTVLPEAIYCLAKKEKQTINDYSAAFCGVIIALLMPAGVPIWLPFAAGLFASCAAKLPFGRLGRSVFSPAAAGFVFVSLVWGEYFESYPALGEKIPFLANWVLPENFEFFRHQTPVQLLSASQIPYPNNAEALENILFFGNLGPVGGIAVLVIVAVFAVMIFRKISAWQSTAAFCATVFLLGMIFKYDGVHFLMSPVYELFCGWMLFSGVFIAGDILTAPRFASARVIYGICCASLAVFLRRISACQGGEIAAVLMMNAVSPAIDRLVWNARQRGISITVFMEKIKFGFEKRMKQFED